MEEVGKFEVAGGSGGRESTYNGGDLVLIPGLGRSPGGGPSNPLQYSCLEDPMDRMTLQLALRLLLLTILQFYHLPPPLPAPVGGDSCLFTQCQPLYASCCSVPCTIQGTVL